MEDLVAMIRDYVGVGSTAAPGYDWQDVMDCVDRLAALARQVAMDRGRGGDVSARPCKRCGMAIEFIEGPNGKAIPLQKLRTIYVTNPPDGKILKVRAFVAEGADAVELHGAYGMPDMPAGEVQIESKTVFVSHFETCPNAKEFSRR